MSIWQKLKCRIGIHKTQEVPYRFYTLKRCYMCGKSVSININQKRIEEAPTNIAFDAYEGPY